MTRSYEDLVPGSLAWIAATHGGPRPDPLARAEAALDTPERRPETDPAPGSREAKAARRDAAKRERARRRAEAKAEKQRAREERARAREEAAAERERERVWAEEVKQLEAEQSAAEAEEREQERAESKRLAEEAAQAKARRRAESKAAARAALATPPGSHRAEPPVDEPVAEAEPSTSQEDTALLEAVGAVAVQEPEAPAEETADVVETRVVPAVADVPAPAATDRPQARHTDTDTSAGPESGSEAVTDGEPVEATPTERPSRARRADRVERRRAKAAAAVARRDDADTDDVPEPPSVPQEGPSTARRVVGLVGVALGVLGLVASVTLALAALLVAFGFDPSTGVLQSVATVADPLTQPLRGLVSFSGENAAAKESFVAYGGGSVVYLAVGVLAPSLLHRPARS
ncbi:hypothetical protein [Aeromicrobium erythreum]|uniref:Uncharacterized protein n=1 Tax=Aeromicrobium erythreum TaxID=2041 RepID=A0A0U4C005_9ACTN|nr:hypothetical protein [Aeromicrobium erythreum]ALX04431.1 hypothetical protein AERYTH_06875 [Aeromicrobium erythreum]